MKKCGSTLVSVWLACTINIASLPEEAYGQSTFGDCAPILTQITGNVDISCVIDSPDESETFKFFAIGLMASTGSPLGPYTCAQVASFSNYRNMSDFARSFTTRNNPDLFTDRWKSWYGGYLRELIVKLEEFNEYIVAPDLETVLNSKTPQDLDLAFRTPLFERTENKRHLSALELGLTLGTASTSYGKMAQINIVLEQHGNIVPDGSVISGVPSFSGSNDGTLEPSGNGTLWQTDHDYLVHLRSCLLDAYTYGRRNLESALARNGLYQIANNLPTGFADIEYRPETPSAWDFVTLNEFVAPQIEGAWR